MEIPLLSTKTIIPPTQPDRVARPRLFEQLDGGLMPGRRLLLVSAPAGYGKTTLVAAWIEYVAKTSHPGSVPPDVAWLSLDESDNDPVRFLTYLLVALQGTIPDVATGTLPMLQSPQPPPPEAILTCVINAMSEHAHPLLLVLDDYYLIHTLAIHQQLAFLLKHIPPQMHVVITTREDPPIPLTRLRARGQTVEIRQSNLQFTPGETLDFLQRVMQLNLSTDNVNALHQRTEGWIAGLQLAAFSLQGQTDKQGLVQAFIGSNRYILDYLIEEVFRQQPEAVQDFLLKTSILKRLNAPLCDALTGRDGGRAMLEQLDRSNLFVIPLDMTRQWFRYHHLFAELLQHRLKTSAPDDVSALHQRAGHWYAGHGFPEDAMHHFLAASDWQAVTDLLRQGLDGQLLSQGRMLTVLNWLQAIPDTIVRADPGLCMAHCWPLILTEHIDAAESYLQIAEQFARENQVQALSGEVAVARVHIARARGDNAGVLTFSEEALALLPPDAFSQRSIVALNLGIAQWFHGRIVEARSAFDQAQHAGHESGNQYARFTALTFLYRIQMSQGQLHQAAEAYRQLIRQAGNSAMLAPAYFDLARVSYEWNALDDALNYIQQGIAVSERSGSQEFIAAGNATLAYIQQARGDAGAAQAALQTAVNILGSSNISPPTRLYISVARILVTLAQGDVMTADALAKQAPSSPQAAGSVPDYMDLMLAQARLALVQGQKSRAFEQATTVYDMASDNGNQWMGIRSRALQAATAPTDADALDFLRNTLDLAKPADYARSFVDIGEPMAHLLQMAHTQGISPDYTRKLIDAFGPDHPSPKPESRRPTVDMIEPLSDRELDVLHLLSQNQTNQEMALALCVSVNTVKTHLKNIYEKLGVHNRRQAVAKAKDLGLLP